MNKFYLPPQEHEYLCSMEKIRVDDIGVVMQKFSSGKIDKPEIGKMQIVDKFVPIFKKLGLMEYENSFVFFAVEKRKTFLFSRLSHQIFIWPILSNKIFKISDEGAVFNQDFPVILDTPFGGNGAGKLIKEMSTLWPIVNFLFKEIPADLQVFFRPNLVSDCHLMHLHKCSFYRQFKIEHEQIIANQDIAYYHLMDEGTPFKVKADIKAPMYYSSHEFILPKDKSEIL